MVVVVVWGLVRGSLLLALLMLLLLLLFISAFFVWLYWCLCQTDHSLTHSLTAPSVHQSTNQPCIA